MYCFLNLFSSLQALKMKGNFLSILCITRLLFIFKIYSGGILLLYLFYFLCFVESLGNRTIYRKNADLEKCMDLLLSLPLRLEYVTLCSFTPECPDLGLVLCCSLTPNASWERLFRFSSPCPPQLQAM